MTTKRHTAVAVIGTGLALLLTACSGGSQAGGGGGGGDGDVTMSFWHNSTTGPGQAYWEETVAAFEEANPGVTIEIQSIQNEDMDGRLQTALNSGDAPDIFMARGGGKLADVVEAGQAQDLTELVDPEVEEAIGPSISAFSIDGSVYGMPTSVLPGGIFYSQELFADAGIESTPTTMDELVEAVDAVRETGVAPIALGAMDAWPAAHWYYFFALRLCSEETVNAAAESRTFDDECWVAAAEELAAFAAEEPFNEGFLTTSAQQGASSSAGLLANHQASMELMGAWNPGVIAGLTPDEQPLADLGWFPFPAVEGGAGDPAAMMGGVDGYSCFVEAPPECAEFLNFFMQQEHQEAYAEAFVTIPANVDAQSAVTDPALQDILASYNEAPYVSVWLDTMYGQNVGNALNQAIVDLLAGNTDPAGVVQAVNDAAARG
ncbi:extracellular solute-binding protein [Georgenia alba]|uniref:Extracellular solute-binding protein n=1 Tax=Georgenia alba TaxID=2233858 RepID=A0ABW2QDL6_9MICO